MEEGSIKPKFEQNFDLINPSTVRTSAMPVEKFGLSILRVKEQLLCGSNFPGELTTHA